MSSPLPGMNPYLENPALWPEVHKWLILLIAETMNPQLRPKYRMAIEERVYKTIDGNGDRSLLVGIPDNVVIRTSPIPIHPQDSNIAIATPVSVNLPMSAMVKEWYLEVKNVGTGAVVTVIEILSPKNKKAGEGRNKYETKREKILDSLTHLIEIDLLHQGKSMPMDSQGIKTDYRILVSRSHQRPKADLYAFNLPDVIPSFPLPLQKGEPEPMINLQELLHRTYDQGSYDLIIDYSCEPVPALSKQNAVWLDDLLQAQRLRAK